MGIVVEVVVLQITVILFDVGIRRCIRGKLNKPVLTDDPEMEVAEMILEYTIINGLSCKFLIII